MDTEYIQVTRNDLATLKARTWLKDSVIDSVGVKLTFNRTDILYIPTTVNVILRSVKLRTYFRIKKNLTTYCLAVARKFAEDLE